jgi:gamma-glutamyl-gamma-aminobutyrate hydrolase PuuD
MGDASPPLIGVVGHWTTHDGERYATAKARYLQAVRQAGGAPVVLIPETSEREIAARLDNVDGLLLTGGYDVDPGVYGETMLNDTVRVDAERDAFELPLARLAFERDVPLLAICRGCQVLNVALGGTLWQDIPAQLPSAGAHRQHAPMAAVTHAVRVAAGSMLACLLDRPEGVTLQTNTAHHQAIRDAAHSLAVVGHAEDGVVEAVGAEGRRFVLGVQWHPESLAEAWPEHLRLFQGLVQASRLR